MKLINKITVGVFAILLSFSSAYAQSPEKMSYQAVVRDASNALLSTKTVGLQISILQGSSTGTSVYTEEHLPLTNANGLLTVEIGDGTVVSGNFSLINWANGPYFIKTELDPAGGMNYTISGTSQLISVPYALHSKTAGNVFSGDYGDLTNTPTMVSAFTNDAGYLTVNFDNDSTNELQVLSIGNDTLYLSNGGSVVLPTSLDNDTTNELQMITYSNDTIFLTDGGFVVLPSNLDNDSTNEIQTLSLNGDTIFLTNGGSVLLPENLDNDTTNEIQILSISNDTIFLSDGGFAVLPSNFDNDSTNEIQALISSNDSISLSNGGGSIESLWKKNGSSIYRFSNVGIGRSNPAFSLHVIDTLLGTDDIGAIVDVAGGADGSGTYVGFLAQIQGTDGSNRGVQGSSIGTSSANNVGVFGLASGSSLFNTGMLGYASGNAIEAAGLYGYTDASGLYNYGVSGAAFGVVGENYGLIGYSQGSPTVDYGVYGWTDGTAGDIAGYFAGDVTVTGNLNVTGSIAKGSGTFKIDHPLDPENKYLVHSFVESPDMMNIYNGNVVTDANGFATVEMPDYFEAANKEFRYQLTVIGTFAQAIVKDKMVGNKFVIQTNQPGVEVSWQVTGVRADKYAEKNRIKVEQDKKAEDKGTYLHPEAFDVSSDRSENAKHKVAVPAKAKK